MVRMSQHRTVPSKEAEINLFGSEGAMTQSKTVSVCPPAVAQRVRLVLTSTMLTSPVLKLTESFEPDSTPCSGARECTLPCSSLIMFIGLALDTDHVRRTPCLSLAVTNVPGMLGMNLHAHRPAGCLENSVMTMGLISFFLGSMLKAPCTHHMEICPLAHATSM